jgi:hypothetical protein
MLFDDADKHKLLKNQSGLLLWDHSVSKYEYRWILFKATLVYGYSRKLFNIHCWWNKDTCVIHRQHYDSFESIKKLNVQ